jgi:hypothetical protein
MQSRDSFLFCAQACALVLPGVRGTAVAQSTMHIDPKKDQKLSLQAAVVLTPEFCATKTKKGTWGVNQETFAIGKVVCEDLEPALKGVFSEVTRVEDPGAAANAQIVLTPKFLDIVATQAKIAFSNRELVLTVEWTAKDKAGKTVWVETVQGSARHHMGNSFTYKKNLNLVITDASKNLAEQSASKIASSQQLHDLANRSAGTTVEKD